jgi:hypothetical protein
MLDIIGVCWISQDMLGNVTPCWNPGIFIWEMNPGDHGFSCMNHKARISWVLLKHKTDVIMGDLA